MMGAGLEDRIVWGVAAVTLALWALVRARTLGPRRGAVLVIGAAVLAPVAGLGAWSGLALLEATLCALGDHDARHRVGADRRLALWLTLAVLLRPATLPAALAVLLATRAGGAWRTRALWMRTGFVLGAVLVTASVNGWLAGYRAPEPLVMASREASALGLLALLAGGWLALEHERRGALVSALGLAAVSAISGPDLGWVVALAIGFAALRDGALGPRVAVFAAVLALVSVGLVHAWPTTPRPEVQAWLERDDGCVEVVGELPVDVGAGCARGLLRAPVYDAREIATRPFFGHGLIDFHRAFAAEGRVAADTVSFTRRESPEELVERDLGVTRWFLGDLPVSEERSVRLSRPVAVDALLVIDVEVRGTWLEPPELSTRAVGRGYRGPATRTPLRHGRQQVFLPVDPRAAAWRWSTGASRDEAPADRLALLLLGAAERASSAELTVLRVREIVPPRESSADACEERARFALERTFVDGVATDAEDGVRLARGRLSFETRPCADRCFYAELGLEEGAAPANATVVVEGHGPPRVVSRRALEPGWREPVVARLDGDGRSTLVRVETDAPVRVYWPRLRRCAGPMSLIHALHEGAYETSPSELEHELIGDELRVPIHSRAESPVRVEIPFTLTEEQADTCVALELDSRGHTPTAGLLVGLRRGRRLYWLGRHAHEARGERIELRDLPVGRFAGRPTALVLSAWVYGDTEPGATALFIRPRLHPCGVEPWWMF